MLTIEPVSRERWKWPLFLLTVGCFAFYIRYYYISHAQVIQPVGDALEYFRYGQNLAWHGVFSKMPPDTIPLLSDSYRDPGYPLLIAAWMKVFNYKSNLFAGILVSQILLSSLTVVVTMALARRWLPLRWLAAAGLLMAVWPHSVAMSGYFLSETLFGFLAALGLLFLRLAFEQRSAWWTVVSGVGLSLAALTNAVLIPFAPLLAIYLWVKRKADRTLCTTFVAAALIVLAPWIARNSFLPRTDGTSSSSSRGLENLVQGSWPSLHASLRASSKHDPDGEAVMRAIDKESVLLEQSFPAGLTVIMNRMAMHPASYVWWYLGKPALLWDWNIRVGQGGIYIYPTTNSPYENNVGFRLVLVLCHAINRWLFVFAIVGILLTLLSKKHAPSDRQAAALILVFVTLVYSVLQAEPRYSVPFRGLEIVFATYAAFRGSQYIAGLRGTVA